MMHRICPVKCNIPPFKIRVLTSQNIKDVTFLHCSHKNEESETNDDLAVIYICFKVNAGKN